MRQSGNASNGFVLLCFAVFVLSGAAGLVYQSIWTQYLGLFLGHAAYAQSLVLALFMGGMALGAWWVSRYAVSWRNLLLAYAIVELAIGLAAIAYHREYTLLTRFAYDTAFPALGPGLAATALKWGIATVLVLPQAILLGTTFPLMSNAVMRRSGSGDGAILSGLYFSNSLGAACGALFATFVLVPAVGLPGAMRVGAILTILAALFAYLLARGQETRMAVESGLRRPVDGGLLLLVASFVTGASSFVYEIGWVRMLSLALGSTAHAFELMLAAFIGGLAFGGLYIRRRIDGYSDVVRVAGFVQLLMGVAALASLMLYDRSFAWVELFMGTLSRSDGAYAVYNILSAAVAVAIMAPTAFFAGMTLPLFTLALMRRGCGEAAVGRIYAANTVGAIAGVLLAVHVLLPELGLKLGMTLAATADLVLGLVLLRPVANSAHAALRERRTVLVAALLVSLAILVTVRYARFDPKAMVAGVYRTGSARIDENERVLFYRDGKTASIGVRAAADGVRVIATNGKPDASINMTPNGNVALDEVTMVMAGALPLALHPAPKEVANIGFGSGLTTHTLLSDSRVERVDTIEIEPLMVEGAKAFLPLVENAYFDPRAKLHIEDARSYFTAHRARYDVIVSEPSNPWVSGVASLFSQEFYRFVPHHLRPGGLFVQWVQLYEINDELVASMVRAMDGSFSDYRVYLSNYGDMIVVASADGLLPELVPERLANPRMRAVLLRQGLADPDDLRFHELGDRRSLSSLFHSLGTRRNSDFYPILSLEAPRSRFKQEMANALIDLPTAELPYIELMSGIPLSNSPVSATQAFPRTGRQRTAYLIAMARKGEYVDGLQPGVRLSMEWLRSGYGVCRADGDDVMRLALLRQIAVQTIPFLPPDLLQGLWIRPDWLDCKDASPSVMSMLKLLESQAARDHAGTILAARLLLSRFTGSLDKDTASYILEAAMLAASAAGQPDEVLRLEREFGNIAANVEGAVYRRWMIRRAREALASLALKSG